MKIIRKNRNLLFKKKSKKPIRKYHSKKNQKTKKENIIQKKSNKRKILFKKVKDLNQIVINHQINILKRK